MKILAGIFLKKIIENSRDREIQEYLNDLPYPIPVSSPQSVIEQRMESRNIRTISDYELVTAHPVSIRAHNLVANKQDKRPPQQINRLGKSREVVFLNFQ